MSEKTQWTPGNDPAWIPGNGPTGNYWDNRPPCNASSRSAAAEVASRVVRAANQQVTADTERARLRDLRERMLLEAARGSLTGSRVIEVARQWVEFVEEG